MNSIQRCLHPNTLFLLVQVEHVNAKNPSDQECSICRNKGDGTFYSKELLNNRVFYLAICADGTVWYAITTEKCGR